MDRAVNISVGVGKVFVADRNFGLHCIDITNPTAPSVLHQATIIPPASGSAFNVFYDNGKAYVAYGTSGMRIINVSNPSSPCITGRDHFAW